MRNIRENLETTEVGAQASNFLTSTSNQLDDEAAVIEREARKNRRLIDKGLKMVYVITTVTISLNLVAVIALSGVCITSSSQSALKGFELNINTKIWTKPNIF